MDDNGIFLSIIVAVKSCSHHQFCDALDGMPRAINFPGVVEYLFVDGCQQADESDHRDDLANRADIRYVPAKLKRQNVSLARLWNLGVVAAKGKYVLLLEVGCVSYDEFVSDLIEVIQETFSGKSVADVMTVPIFKLPISEIDQLKQNCNDKRIFTGIVVSSNQSLNVNVNISSAIVMNRKYYLCIGGANEAIYGADFSRYEIINRIEDSRNLIENSERLAEVDSQENIEARMNSVIGVASRRNISALARGLMLAKAGKLDSLEDEGEAKHFLKKYNPKMKELFLSTLVASDETLTIIITPPVMNIDRKIFMTFGKYIVRSNMYDPERVFQSYINAGIKVQIVLVLYGKIVNDNAIILFAKENDIKVIYIEKGVLPNTALINDEPISQSYNLLDEAKWNEGLDKEKEELILSYVDSLSVYCEDEEISCYIDRNHYGKKFIYVYVDDIDYSDKNIQTIFSSRLDYRMFIQGLFYMLPDEYSLMVYDSEANENTYNEKVFLVNKFKEKSVAKADVFVSITSRLNMLAVALSRTSMYFSSNALLIEGLSSLALDAGDILRSLTCVKNNDDEMRLRFLYYLKFVVLSDSRVEPCRMGIKRGRVLNFSYTKYKEHKYCFKCCDRMNFDAEGRESCLVRKRLMRRLYLRVRRFRLRVPYGALRRKLGQRYNALVFARKLRLNYSNNKAKL